jgi:hypothetical protein
LMKARALHAQLSNLCEIESDSLCMPDTSSHSVGRQPGRRGRFMKWKAYKYAPTRCSCICCLHVISTGIAIQNHLCLSPVSALQYTQPHFHAFSKLICNYGTAWHTVRSSEWSQVRTGPGRGQEDGCVQLHGHGTVSAERSAPYPSQFQIKNTVAVTGAALRVSG